MSRTGDLARVLTEEIEGEACFGADYRGLYATDASNYRQVPMGVVFPRHKGDVERTIARCREHGAPVLPRGGGTSLAGQGCNNAVVLDFTRHMNRVIEVDVARRFARVEPGCVLDDLRDVTRPHGLTFGPDPSTHDRCALGGMLGNNACGAHSVQAALYTGPRTSDNVRRLEVLTYDGARFWTGPTDEHDFRDATANGGRRAEIYRGLRELRDRYGDEIRARFPAIPRRVSGYNLDDLLPEKGFHVARSLVGTEGTCVLFLEAELDLVPDPPESCLAVLAFEDVNAAADAVPRVLEHRPHALEGMDERLIRYNEQKDLNPGPIALLPEGAGFLLVQFKADTMDEACDRAHELQEALEGALAASEGPREVRVFERPDEQAAIWELRESGLGATAFVPGFHDTWPGWEDSAVPPERLGDYLRELRSLLDRHGYDGAFYGHFGDGVVHTRIDFDLVTSAGIERYVTFIHEAAELVDDFGGVYSGEHGDGQARGALLSRLYGEEIMHAFSRFKELWDPEGRMNPGKAAVNPARPDENLRLGVGYDPPPTETFFQFPEDEGSFARATLRCVGVGKCRRTGGGTMCPSYMVTLDEKHSTRGRAHLLFEMMNGDVVGDVWRSDEVAEALDLCLSCKGCKSDCPVSVDMATYKAEFRAHYYEHKLRPKTAYTMGLIHWWSRLGSRMPRFANWASHTEPLSRVLKWAAGVHPNREIPRLSARTFVDRYRESRAVPDPRADRVVLFPDTFSNHYLADSAMAGARALERLGYQVIVPDKPLCCGRPLYDFGFLPLARKLLLKIIEELRPHIESGVPVVAFEPSCVATFRDELPNLFPHLESAKRLCSQTYLFGEFLDRFVDDDRLPEMGGRALLHGHCHQKSVLDFDADRRVLERMGVEVDVPDTGCCGMAGPFGFEKDHYDVSQACAERALLPAIRALDERAEPVRVITDGFSCREQIAQNLGVRAQNLTEVVWEALSGDGAPAR